VSKPVEEENDPCVLLVEDNDLLRAVRARQLRDECFRVLIARDGESALRMLAENRVDVVAADYWLPGMDGVTLLEEVRARYPDVGRVICSGNPPPAVERWAAENEVPLIVKGHDPTEKLVVVLREQCMRRGRPDTGDGEK
jgi:two-component system, cell cycle sensor histidine kinase and response regulator CckA